MCSRINSLIFKCLLVAFCLVSGLQLFDFLRIDGQTDVFAPNVRHLCLDHLFICEGRLVLSEMLVKLSKMELPDGSLAMQV